MSGIYIFSGAVQSGKTTRITRWIRNKTNVEGILQPVINGKRYLRQISSGETRLLEIQPDSDEENIICVGKYKFSGDIFAWARHQLLSAYQSNPEWLIIDEFGKLEIEGGGLEPAVSKILSDLIDHPNTNQVIIIRDYLVTDFLDKYKLTENDIKSLEM
jgi:nucleoside-triphosphatase